MSATATSQSQQPWSILFLLGAAQFMVILDITVVNVALPSIGAARCFAAADVEWGVTIYVLFTGGLLLLGGRLADRFDRRLVFLAGLSVFTAASLASGLAPSPGALSTSIVSAASAGRAINTDASTSPLASTDAATSDTNSKTLLLLVVMPSLCEIRVDGAFISTTYFRPLQGFAPPQPPPLLFPCARPLA
jgi:MFS family permease